MPTDPKWRVIAKRSGRPIPEVISVFIFVMTSASANATERGRTQGLFVEDIAASLDIQEGDIQAIMDAMQGRVMNKDRLTGWNKRQPQREDNAADRAKKWREEQKRERNRTQENATERPDKDKEEDTDKEKTKTFVHQKPMDDDEFELEPDPPKKEDKVLDLFNSWWSTYWRLDAKQVALRAFRKHCTTPRKFKVIMAATLAQTPKMLSKPQEGRPHGASWLNGKRWEDPIEEVPVNSNGNGRNGHVPSADSEQTIAARREAERFFRENAERRKQIEREKAEDAAS
jgi:hypothetical protein